MPSFYNLEGEGGQLMTNPPSYEDYKYDIDYEFITQAVAENNPGKINHIIQTGMFNPFTCSRYCIIGGNTDLLSYVLDQYPDTICDALVFEAMENLYYWDPDYNKETFQGNRLFDVIADRGCFTQDMFRTTRILREIDDFHRTLKHMSRAPTNDELELLNKLLIMSYSAYKPITSMKSKTKREEELKKNHLTKTHYKIMKRITDIVESNYSI